MYLIKPKYDLVVYIGRFSPFHLGHEETLKNAFELGANVLLLVGSANESRTTLNPWTYAERRHMIDAWKNAAQGNGLMKDKGFVIFPLDDETYNDIIWCRNVQHQVGEAVRGFRLDPATVKIALIGCDSDETTYYLHQFPLWKAEIAKERTKIIDWTGNSTKEKFANATEIREIFFNSPKNRWPEAAGYYVPIPVMKEMNKFIDTAEFNLLTDEYWYIKEEQEKWADTPYPVIFQTVDCVVIQSGHVLLVQRGGRLGNGKWAMPGGYVNPDEKLLSAAIRELREETGLKVPVPVLVGSVAVKGTYDSPRRSQLGRVITRAFLFKLKDEFELPHVKGGDDAAKALWVPICDFYGMRDRMFDDHFHIINSLIRKL